ncbi:PrsW family intramembrane metalloprotease [Patescibacteria group bacterium]|nr:PrsW family intramembrane metalloprotease [Patescibacteria group bacterium]MBU4116097.1 PrsW family intramembrane metalloprotease [Patescibacteria group bacterium]
MNFDFQTILIALVGGILPALFWLWFWLKEDKKRPEPRGLIILTFLGGFVAVLLALFIENAIDTSAYMSNIIANLGFGIEKIMKFFKENYSLNHLLLKSSVIIVLWSTTEEILKYLASYITALRRKEMDEPVDAMIYLITTALGFAALENVLFLVSSFYENNIFQALMDGNMRFMGATVLHTLTSGVVGLFIALSFYKSVLTKKIYLLIGLILSVALHSIFNLLIINSGGENIFLVFGLVWFAIMVLILLFEKVKRIKK